MDNPTRDMDDVNDSQTEYPLDVTVPDTEYPQELLDVHYIEDSRLHHASDNVTHGLDVLLIEKGVFQEMSPGEFPAYDRWWRISEYIEPCSQEELYQEMRQHNDPVVSSAAKYIDPEWKPQTEDTFQVVQMATSFGYRSCEGDCWCGLVA